MKILFDTNTPAQFARALSAHDVTLAIEVGWDRLEDGVLLDAAERDGFQVFITCDQNIPRQQNFASRKIAVLVLSSNSWPIIRPVAQKIADLVNFLQRGQVRRIDVRAL